MLESNDLTEFLLDNPYMSIVSSSDTSICLRGKFCFKVNDSDYGVIEDSYKLEIIIPDSFPLGLPIVKEIDGKIPRNLDFHMYHNGSFCLGAQLRLLAIMQANPSLTGFVNKCLVPYLYAVSHKLKNGGGFVFGELGHNIESIVDDFCDMMGLKEEYQIVQTKQLLKKKKRIANKKACPCGCGNRLGVCPLHYKLNELRIIIRIQKKTRINSVKT